MFTSSTACLEVKPALPRFRNLEFCFDEDRQIPLHYLPLAVQAKLTQLRSAVNVSHHAYLVVSLLGICLVDTKSVNPEQSRTTIVADVNEG
jgi:hypothetical protein